MLSTQALIAKLATWLGIALQIGPLGAYMFLLACTAATAMPTAQIVGHEAYGVELTGGHKFRTSSGSLAGLEVC